MAGENDNQNPNNSNSGNGGSGSGTPPNRPRVRVTTNGFEGNNAQTQRQVILITKKSIKYWS